MAALFRTRAVFLYFPSIRVRVTIDGQRKGGPTHNSLCKEKDSDFHSYEPTNSFVVVTLRVEKVDRVHRDWQARRGAR